MIHEFAIDPSSVASWLDAADFRYFVKELGVGSPRVASRFPKNWARKVYESVNAKSVGDIKMRRLEELITRLKKPCVIRGGGNWLAENDWIDNAVTDHGRCPFRAIVSDKGPSNVAAIHSPSTIASAGQWNCDRDVVVNRKANDLAECLAPLLRNAGKIVIVDPWFSASSHKHTRSLRAIAARAASPRPGAPLECILIRTKATTGGPVENFKADCQDKLPRLLPEGLKLRVTRLKERDDGETLHNRYVLTEIGGVRMGYGIDEGSKGATDDLSVMSEESWRLRWHQYASDCPAFEIEEASRVEIVGRAAESSCS